MTATLLLAGLLASATPLSNGDHTQTLKVDARERSYLVHVPKTYKADKPVPVVIVLHGAGLNASIMAMLCGMNKKSDSEGFIAVYPNGTGVGIFQTFNSGGFMGPLADKQPNDVKFIAAVLDDLGKRVKVDAKRVYATGLSNGGMMCYRLASEMSERIAAIAPVSGTMGIDLPRPRRKIPVLHIHGTADRIVPYAGPNKRMPSFVTFKSVDDTLRIWTRFNGCVEKPVKQQLEDRADDGTTVTRFTYAAQRGGAEVQLLKIHNGGHIWPGRKSFSGFTGKSTRDIAANDVIWEFFQRHRLP